MPPPDQFPAWMYAMLRDAKGRLETDQNLALPTQYDIHEYSIMERFCRSVEDDDIHHD